MRAVVFDGALRFRENIPVPDPPKGWARIRVLLAGICGTDKEILKGYQRFKGVLGHEFVGIVEQCDDDAWVGRRVVGEINVSCGKCRWCKSDLPGHCARRKVLGINGLNGCMAEYCILPTSNLYRVPAVLSHEQAVLIEPLSAACRVPEQLQLAGTERVVVLGDGPLGILCAWVLRTVVSSVTLVGHHPQKLGVAKWHGTEVVQGTHESLCGADIVLEATGSADGLREAIEVCRPEGTIVLKSTISMDEPMNLSPLVVNEQTLLGSRCGNFESAFQLLSRYPDLPLPKLLTASYPIEHAKNAFDNALTADALKVIIHFN
ncbi:MAG TPA: alcohol dehydrogenase catalytic domain-containing protein [Desulfobacteria bacterium]|nr:alcohol dehydrogenase catalytic domain-containing protein [Desulfobacteria bacterium]